MRLRKSHSWGWMVKRLQSGGLYELGRYQHPATGLVVRRKKKGVRGNGRKERSRGFHDTGRIRNAWQPSTGGHEGPPQYNCNQHGAHRKANVPRSSTPPSSSEPAKPYTWLPTSFALLSPSCSPFFPPTPAPATMLGGVCFFKNFPTFYLPPLAPPY